MTLKEIRWKQRFNNLTKAYSQFKNAHDRFTELSALEKKGLYRDLNTPLNYHGKL